MRVTQNTLRSVFLNAMQLAQQRIQKTQTQIATGQKVNRPSDDPLAAARIRELEVSLSRLDQYQSNGIIAKNRLGLEEEALAGVVNNLNRIRELAVQANTATNNSETHGMIALEMRERLSSVIDLANMTDGEGRFLFAGYAEKTQPFVATAAGISYAGDHGQRMVQIGDVGYVAVGDSGADVFQRIPRGNGTFILRTEPGNTGTASLGAGILADPGAYVRDDYSIDFLTPTDYEVRDSGGALISSGTFVAGQSISFRGMQIEIQGNPAAGDSFGVLPSTRQDVFTTIQDLIDALDDSVDGPAARAQLNSHLGQFLVDVDQAIDHMINVRAGVGTRLNAVEAESSLNEGFTIQLTETLSQVQDVDYAETVSHLTQQLFGLEATQQSFARLQGLSLFRYL